MTADGILSFPLVGSQQPCGGFQTLPDIETSLPTQPTQALPHITQRPLSSSVSLRTSEETLRPHSRGITDETNSPNKRASIAIGLDSIVDQDSYEAEAVIMHQIKSALDRSASEILMLSWQLIKRQRLYLEMGEHMNILARANADDVMTVTQHAADLETIGDLLSQLTERVETRHLNAWLHRNFS